MFFVMLSLIYYHLPLISKEVHVCFSSHECLSPSKLSVWIELSIIRHLRISSGFLACVRASSELAIFQDPLSPKFSTFSTFYKFLIFFINLLALDDKYWTCIAAFTKNLACKIWKKEIPPSFNYLLSHVKTAPEIFFKFFLTFSEYMNCTVPSR